MVKQIDRKGTDLFGWPLVGALFKHKYMLFGVRAAVLFLFLSAVYFGLLYPQKEVNPYTTAVFWSLFWPFFMIVSLILIGPGFCGICPHGTMGRWLTRVGRKKEMPTWLKHKGIGLAVLLSAYWVPVYLFPGLLETPWVVALLFLVLTLVAAFVYFQYKDMAYCTYLCPIGAVTKAYGKVGMAKLETYRDACAECKTFECAKACDVNLQPFLFEKKNSMRECTLCMECAQACEAVSFSIVKPASGLTGTIKDRDTIHTWVYILLFAVITMTMRLHHGLGHSSLKTSLPWYKMGEWTQSLLPIGVDWVGFYALLSALLITALFVFGGFKIAAGMVHEPFKTFLHKNSYALAPVMIIGSLSHIGTFFFLHYAGDLGNAYYWLIGSAETMKPLASMRDGWVHLFSLFGFLGGFWSLGLLYTHIETYSAPFFVRFAAWLAASSVIWVYMALLVLQMAVRH